jgi:hypothetical protein
MSENTKREVIIDISVERARNIIDNGAEGFALVQQEIINHNKHYVVYRAVFKRVTDGKFFATTYRQGGTMMKEDLAFEYENPIFREVFPQEVTIIKYI